jgi:hypothetical protein
MRLSLGGGTSEASLPPPSSRMRGGRMRTRRPTGPRSEARAAVGEAGLRNAPNGGMRSVTIDSKQKW